MYQLIISPKAQKELYKLKRVYQLAIKQILEDFKEAPEQGKILSRNLTGKYSYKMGSFRVIYKINKLDKIINILSAGHRSTVYN